MWCEVCVCVLQLHQSKLVSVTERNIHSLSLSFKQIAFKRQYFWRSLQRTFIPTLVFKCNLNLISILISNLISNLNIKMALCFSRALQIEGLVSQRYVHISFYAWYSRTLICLKKTSRGGYVTLWYGWHDNFGQVSVIFTALNCPRSTLISIQLTPHVCSVRLREAFGSRGLSVGAFPSGEPPPWASLITCTSTAPPPPAPTSLTLLPNPGLLSSCHLSARLLYLPLIIYPCTPSAAFSAPLL